MTVPQLPVTEYLMNYLTDGGLTTGYKVDLEFFDDTSPEQPNITLVSRGGSTNIELGSPIVEITVTGTKDGNVFEPLRHMEAIKSYLIPAATIRQSATTMPIFHFNIVGDIMPFRQFNDGRKSFALNVECLTTRSEGI